MGWYRIRFQLGNLRREGLGILLGRIGDADETFLNGRKIGGEGLIGRRFVEAPLVERLYPVPDSMVLTRGDNLIAVRVMNSYLQGGIFDHAILVGDYNRLLIEKTKRESRVIAVSLILLTFLSIFVLFCFLIYLSGVHEREYLSFAVFVLLYTAIYLFDSVVFYHLGLKTPLVQKAILSLTALLPASLLFFLASAYRDRLTFVIKSIILLCCVLALAFMFTLTVAACRLLYYVWMVLAVITASHALLSSVRALKRRAGQSGAFLTGVILVCAAVLSWILEMLGILPTVDLHGHAASELAVPFTILCFVYAVGLRFSFTLRSITSFSERILVAHEEERKRLARELHDGLGQSLLTAKLNLQRMDREEMDLEKQKRLVEGSIEELAGSIEELRDISAGLRPPFLEEMGLAVALRMYGQKVSAKTGVRVEVTADLDSRPAPVVEDNLFRIFQEALTNASKHSQARLVRILLTLSKNKMIMQITDDGVGFDHRQMHLQGRGIGLKTMEERVNLMGGTLHLRSSRGKGTTIKVEAPLR